MNASLVRKQTNFNVCPVQSGVRGVETCRGNQISNLLTGWNRADRENSTLNRIRPAACPLVILCTKTDEARVRIVTPIIGCIGGEGRSTMARRKICSTRMRDESYRVRTFVRVHSVPGRDLCRCRLFVFFATIIPRIYWIRLPPFFLFFFARSACVARCLFCTLGVEDSNEDKLIPFSVFQFSTRERLLVKNLRRASAFRIYSRFGIDVHHCRGWISSLCFFSVTTGKTELWIEYTRRVVCCFKDSLHLGYDGISRMSRVMF